MPPAASLRVLFATSECSPIITTGGLGDVSRALPLALRALELDVRVLLPAYRGVAERLRKVDVAATLPPSLHFPAARLLAAVDPGLPPLYLLDCPTLYDRDGDPYVDEHGVDHKDNDMRFGLLSEVAARLGTAASPIEWRAHIVHANDWPTGLAPAYLHFHADRLARSVMTIHNLAFQGLFPADTVCRVGLPEESFAINGLEYHGLASFLKAGLYYADGITTVSSTYAKEIQRAPLGFGMEGLLSGRSAAVLGILNGIDTELWDPERDKRIPAPFSASALDGKARNRVALCERFGLECEADIPVASMVGRLTWQKGIDLVLNALPALLALPLRLAVLGDGDGEYEMLLQELARRHRGRLGVVIGFGEELARLAQAGADLFLMPSRFEPCGLNQMVSQRYGTLPVAHATGGLVDSITEILPETLANGTASGFLFHHPSETALIDAVKRAIETWNNRDLWRELQRNAMAKDFSWGASARRYRDVYESVLRPDVRKPLASQPEGQPVRAGLQA